MTQGYLYGHSDVFLNTLRNDFDRNTCSFMIMKGDITNAGTQTQFDDYTNFISSPSFTTSTYHVVGNHDKRDTYWETAFLTLTSSGATDYSFDYSGWHFIILDSAQPNDDEGHFSNETLTFLDNDLNLNQGKKTLIFMHHIVNDIPGVTDNPYVDSGFAFADNRQEFKDIIHQYPDVWIVFSGHVHINSVTFKNNILYVVTGPTIHYPCQYNLIHVYENAVIQEGRKISGSIYASEQSRAGIYNWIDTNYGFLGSDIAQQAVDGIYGELRDRCFLYVHGEYFVSTLKLENKAKIYPNPVKQRDKVTLEIEFQKSEIINRSSIKLFDISGTKVLQKEFKEFSVKKIYPFTITYELDLKNESNKKLASGIYLYILEINTSQNEFIYEGKIAIIK